MKNSYECDNLEELQNICFAWMQIANRFKAEKEVLIDICLENGINCSLNEILRRLNEKAFNEQK